MAPESLKHVDFINAVVNQSATVKEAIRHMTHEAALVVDDDGLLRGLVTDGDLRRAFLGGATMDTLVAEFMTASPMTITEDAPKEKLLSIMVAKKIRHLPVVDANGRPVGLEHLKNHFQDTELAEAVLMAGGKGTRLRPLTDTTPKPLLSVGDKTILDNILDGLNSCGVKDAIISINYLGEQIKNHVKDGADRGMNIAYVEEEKALGTAGALSLLTPRPRRSFIVMNADLITDLDYGRLCGFHTRKGNDVSVCVRRVTQTIPYGVVSLDGDQLEVASIVEKPELSHLVNAGIYMLDPKVIDLVPRDTFFDMVSLIRAALGAGYKVGAFPVLEYWRDIGRHEEMEAAIRERQGEQPCV